MKFSPWPYFEEDEIQAVVDVLKSGKVNQWTGNEVTQFESEFADYIGSDYAIALANGSLALDLALICYDIGEGDEVIVTPRTFMASVSCLALRGAIPVFVDVDLESQNITLEGIQRAVSPKTKAIIAVNLGGWPCELDEISKFCNAKGLILIEDCAQSHGAEYNGKKTGSFGNCGIFSFCQDKIMTTGGEGGMFVTNDRKIWQKAWSYKDHGKNYDAVFNKDHLPGFRWFVDSLGTNFRMTEMQAALGRVILKKLDKWVEKRRSLADQFNKGLSKIPGLRITMPPSNVSHAYYKYYVFIDPEKLKKGFAQHEILEQLSARGIPCAAGICPEVYLEKAFETYPFKIVMQ
ncbi:MAG: DegT/DnrJ/EryC1/StrS aminotransferase family protein, partial [Desulfobacteraceae bacterium]|nr:DegT/DnrJ/EryC1/StrS aminotransferase family protein [Desulfobacteraceae bacterium]